jgi:predicted aldo/keto reductase-like oxidoreductase
MGRALRDGYREKVFLMTKLDGRTRASAANQIDESAVSLQRLLSHLGEPAYVQGKATTR